MGKYREILIVQICYSLRFGNGFFDSRYGFQLGSYGLLASMSKLTKKTPSFFEEVKDI
jgi:hypothetical protein